MKKSYQLSAISKEAISYQPKNNEKYLKLKAESHELLAPFLKLKAESHKLLAPFLKLKAESHKLLAKRKRASKESP